jgi:hypothetical protein
MCQVHQQQQVQQHVRQRVPQVAQMADLAAGEGDRYMLGLLQQML